MTGEPAQMVFDLALRPALGAEDFMVSRANAAALDLVDRWPDWPHFALIVQGAAQTGKTHLGNVWRLRSGAHVVAADAVSEDDVAGLMQRRAILVENLERGVRDERALFHLFNLVREHRFTMLLTSRVAPGDLVVTLPDLRSRLRALPVTTITEPDEDLLRAVLVKHVSDRQLTVEPNVIAHIVLHLDRSMQAAAEIVADIDRRALATKRRVTRVLAAEALAARNQNPIANDEAGS